MIKSYYKKWMPHVETISKKYSCISEILDNIEREKDDLKGTKKMERNNI